MGAPTPAAPRSHSGLRFPNRLPGALEADGQRVPQCATRSGAYGCAVRTIGNVLERLAAVDAERLELIAALRTVGFR
ncbi:MAG: hypothetical protein QOI20_3396, partial [Acidimicrobiaceae bacterium]|nr:hypothetical protein [Acidimicrobiaceae bacterium]